MSGNATNARGHSRANHGRLAQELAALQSQVIPTGLGRRQRQGQPVQRPTTEASVQNTEPTVTTGGDSTWLPSTPTTAATPPDLAEQLFQNSSSQDKSTPSDHIPSLGISAYELTANGSGSELTVTYSPATTSTVTEARTHRTIPTVQAFYRVTETKIKPSVPRTFIVQTAPPTLSALTQQEQQSMSTPGSHRRDQRTLGTGVLNTAPGVSTPESHRRDQRTLGTGVLNTAPVVSVTDLLTQPAVIDLLTQHSITHQSIADNTVVDLMTQPTVTMNTATSTSYGTAASVAFDLSDVGL